MDEVAQALSSFASTALWVLLITAGVWYFRKHLKRLADAIGSRVEEGSGLRLGSMLELLPGLEKVPPQADAEHARMTRHDDAPASEEGELLPTWTDERERIGKEQRGVHLAHLLGPTDEPQQEFELFIYLVEGADRQSGYGLPDDLSDVKKAEFYLGKMWGNRITTVRRTPGRRTLGIRTTAYAPVICLCKITFRDGETAVLARFIDFEMARILPPARPTG